MKTLLLISVLFFVTFNAYTQDITNTLGTDGEFIVKDGSTTFLTLTQSDGHIKLPYSVGSTKGFIFQEGDRFLHNYRSSYSSNGFNTFLGILAGNFIMTGTGDDASYNTGIGHGSLSSLYIGYGNTALGSLSLNKNDNGYRNTAIGVQSLVNNTSGYDNTAVGYHSLYFNTTGDHNTAVGYHSLIRNTTSDNTAVGWCSMNYNTTGDYNTAIGTKSLWKNTTGQGNTTLGSFAGWELISGHNNTLIGMNSQPSSSTVSNEITLGNDLITALRCNVTTITSLSDARDKKNINDLSLGLDFIKKLKPRQFNWDRREWYENNKSDGSKMEEELSAGFIAQELDELQQSENAEWLELVYDSNPEKLEATTGNLLPVMVKAIQELNDKNEILEEEIAQLKSEVETLKNVNEKLVKLEKLIMEMKVNENEIKEIKSSSN